MSFKKYEWEVIQMQVFLLKGYVFVAILVLDLTVLSVRVFSFTEKCNSIHELHMIIAMLISRASHKGVYT